MVLEPLPGGPDGPEDLSTLAERVRDLRQRVARHAEGLLATWGDVGELDGDISAANLAAYLTLRQQDVRDLQDALADLGLSSLGRCEPHVLATLDAVSAMLTCAGGTSAGAGADADDDRSRAAADGVGPPPGERTSDVDRDASTRARRSGDARLGGVGPARQQARRQVERNAQALFGQPLAGRHPRIMVTLPAVAADEPGLVEQLVAAGMDCARINCGHDDPETWTRLATSVRAAAARAGRVCTVLMDLSGPRLRLGSVADGPAVVRLRPRRDARGVVVAPAEVLLDGKAVVGRRAERTLDGRLLPAHLPVDPDWLAQLGPGDEVALVDAPGRRRVLHVVGHLEGVARCEVGSSCWIEPGTELQWLPRQGIAAVSDIRRTCRVGPLPAARGAVRVGKGEALLLARAGAAGTAAGSDGLGRTGPARVPVGEPRVLDDLRPGHRVIIDGGVVEAVVERVDDEGAHLRVQVAPAGGAKLRSEKGLNLPDTAVSLPSLTAEDLLALDHAIELADTIGYSFVRTGDDVTRLVDELALRGAEHMAVLLKVETAAAVANLPELIVRASRRHPVGVMIARGDLAVEIGYERLAEVQEEILWVAEAAHVPVVWATQVLENLVHTGTPTRAEISDAAMAERADCVMLNKGPHLARGVEVLHEVLRRMAPHRHKKTDLLPPMRLVGAGTWQLYR